MGANQIFLIYFIIFAGVLIFAGYYSKKWISDTSDFILAGREVSLMLNVFGVMAIGFAGTVLALSPSLAVSFGFWGSLAWGLIYSIGGLAFYGLFFSDFIRKCGAQTLPEWLEMRFSSKVRLIVTVTTVLGLTGIMANNIVSMAAIITGYVGWPLWVSISGCFFVILMFSFFSGLWAVTLTDFIQMLIGFVAIPLLIFSLVTKFGGSSFLHSSWPGENFWTAGITGAQMPILSLKYPSVLSMMLLFACFLVWGNNYYWLRVASCRSERVAKQSYFWTGLALVPIVFLPLTLLGIYAASAYPDMFAPIGKVSAAGAYGVVLKILPPAVASFLLIGALAASISTAATAHIGATSTAVRDIYQRVFRPNASAKELLIPSKVILLLIGAVTWLLCFYPGGPVYLFAFANSWLGPPSILVLLGMTWRRFNAPGALWGAIFGMITMAVLTFLELSGSFVISKYMHVGVAGFIVTLVLSVIISLSTAPKYFGAPSWDKEPGANNRENIETQPIDLKVLEMLRYGHDSMSELTDALKVDSRYSNESVERLDRGGYIKRHALSGANFYSFEITPKGLSLLPKLPEKEATMAADSLKPLYVKVLQMAAKDPEKLPEFAKEENLASLEVASIISHMVKKGYILEKGLWKRVLQVTDKGYSMINKYADAL